MLPIQIKKKKLQSGLEKKHVKNVSSICPTRSLSPNQSWMKLWSAWLTACDELWSSLEKLVAYLMIFVDVLDISFPQNSLMDRKNHMRAQSWFYSFSFSTCARETYLIPFVSLSFNTISRILISFLFKWDKKNICFGLDLNYAYLDIYPKAHICSLL